MAENLRYSEVQKKRLAYRGRRLNKFLLATVERTFALE